MRTSTALVVASVVLASHPAHAQFNSGSTGAHGALNPSAHLTLTLPASGVFNFTTVNIPGGVILRFTRNATNTPATILAQGDVIIAGTMDVSGSAGGAGSLTGTLLGPNGGAGGPGGFDGGTGANGVISTTGGAGLGPGGGSGGANSGSSGGGGGHVAVGGSSSGAGAVTAAGGGAYGTAGLLPISGGSGGGGGGAAFGATGFGGGGGGGALLIASSTTITLSGTIRARGGNGATGPNPSAGFGGSGSGGAVRLVANTVGGNGTIDVNGGDRIGGFFGGSGGFFFNGAGSAGRLRLESFTNTAVLNFVAVPPTTISSSLPNPAVLANAPTLRISSIAGVATPGVAQGSFVTPDITLPAGTTNPVPVTITAANIPVGTVVTLTVLGFVGTVSSVTATLGGTAASSSATASLTIPTNEPSVVSASATFTLLVDH